MLAAHTLLDDSKTLFSLLGLNGRRRHQAEVTGAVTTICEGLSTLVNLECTGSSSLPRMHDFASTICLAGSDLEVLQRLLSLWDGTGLPEQQAQLTGVQASTGMLAQPSSSIKLPACFVKAQQARPHSWVWRRLRRSRLTPSLPTSEDYAALGPTHNSITVCVPGWLFYAQRSL